MLTGADSIDLQDSNSPSAQDHTRQPTHPGPRGVGPPAPHQAEALREVAAEAAGEQLRSPRVSKEWSNGDLQQLQQYGDDELAVDVSAALNGTNPQQQDALAVAQNGGLTGSTAEDAEMADAEGDDGMDDDMMDKISSSPSIDDGGYSPTQMWPQRVDSLSPEMTPLSSSSFPQACSESSSPYVQTTDHYPVLPLHEPDKDVCQAVWARKHHHLLLGEYLDTTCDNGSNYDEENDDELAPLRTDLLDPYAENDDQDYNHNYDVNYYSEEALANHLSIEQNNVLGEVDQDGVMTIPYESSEEEDDDDFFYPTDSRFVDSGWGGECLQESEDIDFEFVYALHTFVATVEGQANATKGDTMVLLDDSNSYWWLVRVVKDSSIGELSTGRRL